MHAYSMDLRTRVLAACDAGQSNDAVARVFDVSTAWIRRLKQRRRETGSCAAAVRRSPAPRYQAHADALQQLVAQRPDATLQELRDALGLTASVATLCRMLQRLRLTVKKSRPRRRAGPARRRPAAGAVAGGDGSRPARAIRVH
jgi:transposase